MLLGMGNLQYVCTFKAVSKYSRIYLVPTRDDDDSMSMFIYVVDVERVSNGLRRN
jgi:hypothetical protein